MMLKCLSLSDLRVGMHVSIPELCYIEDTFIYLSDFTRDEYGIGSGYYVGHSVGKSIDGWNWKYHVVYNPVGSSEDGYDYGE